MGTDPSPLTGLRETTLEHLASGTLDVLVIGGGVNGAGVLRDLALRSIPSQPLRVALVEQRHFSSGTSGRNSQLIHGGLRYLKNFEIKLVSEALAERAILLRTAPHLVEPLAFLIPMRDRFSAAFYGAGLYLYDLLAGKNRIERHRAFTARQLHAIEPAIGHFTSGARFFDCRVHSARLVILNIRDAVTRGAHAVNYVCVESCTKNVDGMWSVELLDTLNHQRVQVRARAVVDATGAWTKGSKLRLVRGSHLVLPRIGKSENAISYFGDDGRIIFFIPWGRRHAFTLLGTTDVDHHGGPDHVRISPDEVRYLMDVVEKVFPGTGPHQPISAYSSLRPLVRDESSSATKTSREHRIWADEQGMVHVTGGKYTTYRLMSEEAANLVTSARWPELNSSRRTAEVELLGNTREAVRDLLERVPDFARTYGLPERDAQDLVKHYGVETPDVLQMLGVSTPTGLTRLEAAQIAFAARQEFVTRLSDLMFISTYWGYEQRWTAELLEPYANELARHLNWTKQQIQAELADMLDTCDQPLAN